MKYPEFPDYESLNAECQAWYDALTEDNHEELRNSYIDKVTARHIPASYNDYLVRVVKLGVHFAGDEEKLDKMRTKIGGLTEKLERKQVIKAVRSQKGNMTTQEYKKAVAAAKHKDRAHDKELEV